MMREKFYGRYKKIFFFFVVLFLNEIVMYNIELRRKHLFSPQCSLDCKFGQNLQSKRYLDFRLGVQFFFIIVKVGVVNSPNFFTKIFKWIVLFSEKPESINYINIYTKPNTERTKRWISGSSVVYSIGRR